MYRGGIRERALVWLDFEDWRMGTLGVEAAQVPRIGKSIVVGSSSFYLCALLGDGLPLTLDFFLSIHTLLSF